MSDNPKFPSSPPQSGLSLQQDDPISPAQTLADSDNNNNNNLIEDDDLVPCTFNLDPSSSSSYFNEQVNSNSYSFCLYGPESESDYSDSTFYPDCLSDRYDDYDQVDFLTDLFGPPGEIELDSTADVGIRVSDSSINVHDDEFVSNNNIDNLGLGLGDEDLSAGQNDVRIESAGSNLEHERDGLRSVIDRIEEISVLSDISSEGDSGIGVLEWEILLAVNNFERDLEFAADGGGGGGGGGDEDGFEYSPEFDTLIGQFVESVRALRGSPPAAKSFIDNLPLVVLKKEDDSVMCAVCKEEMFMEERVTQLPCKHYYHGECIVPWLSIRNTCPVCRFELPTDDVDYERSKNRVDDGDDEQRVGYGFRHST